LGIYDKIFLIKYTYNIGRFYQGIEMQNGIVVMEILES